MLACNHIPFSICQTISSTKVLVVGFFGGFLSPTDFITVHVYMGRWYVLVVEPSPIFRYRSLAADCPIRLIFRPSHLPFQVLLWFNRLKDFPAIHPIFIQRLLSSGPYKRYPPYYCNNCNTDWQSRGQGFESPRLHQEKPCNFNNCRVFMFYSIGAVC